jgi:SAM-dependent methyltransferase
VEEILTHLPAAAKVLDLGSRTGSYDVSLYPFLTVRVDIDPISGVGVQADASRLPFADGCFDAVIANHSLEHIDRLDECLCEIGRVLRRDGAFYVAVPDATTLTDRLYRWLARGGGHVNPFRSPDELATKIEAATGLPHIATRLLFTSLSFLNRRHSPRPVPRKLWLLGGGHESILRWLVWLLKQSDARFGSG